MAQRSRAKMALVKSRAVWVAVAGPAAAAALVWGCGGGGADGGGGGGSRGTTRWRVMVYMAADNDLAPSALRNLNAMEEVGSSDLVDIVVQADLREGSGGSCRRLKIERDEDTSSVTSPVLEELGEKNMADPAVLEGFLEWAQSGSPAADRSLLVLWGHGLAWQNESAVRISSIFDDWGSGTPSFLMPNHLVREALQSSGLRPDVVAFDACAMASIEAAYEFRNTAAVMVASQEAVWTDGFPYETILAALAADTDVSPEGLAARIVSLFGSYYTETVPRWEQCLSALRLPAMEALAEKVHALAETLRGMVGDDAFLGRLEQTRADAEGFTAVSPAFVDLEDFAALLGERTGLDTAAVRDGVRSAIVGNYHRGTADRGHPDANGLSIYFPLSASLYDRDSSYDNYDPQAGTGSPSGFMSFGWDEFLKAYFAAASR